MLFYWGRMKLRVYQSSCPINIFLILMPALSSVSQCCQKKDFFFLNYNIHMYYHIHVLQDKYFITINGMYMA